MAPDPIKVDPKHYKLEFENDRIRVLRISYGPHEKSVMHGHPPCIAVMLSDGDFRFKLPYGRRQDMLGKAGQILPFEEAQEHLPENLSNKSFEAVLIELKS
jgi:quercetin dioxygenase-like cupin family protein